MDAIKDFFAELKERASNPLISSFIIAWLIINWPVTIGLLFYTQKELELDHIKSYTALIARYSSIWYYTIIPLSIAIAYAFLFPFVKAGIRLVHARVSAKNESDILRATKQGMMPVKKYVELRDAQTSMTSELQALIDSQGTIHAENEELIIKLAEESRKHNDLLSEFKRMREKLAANERLDELSLLEGAWKFTIKDVNGQDVVEKWEIDSNQVTINGTTNLLILNFAVNSKTSKVGFTFADFDEHGNRQSHHNYWFKYNPEFTELKSSESPELLLVKDPLKVQFSYSV